MTISVHLCPSVFIRGSIFLFRVKHRWGWLCSVPNNSVGFFVFFEPLLSVVIFCENYRSLRS